MNLSYKPPSSTINWLTGLTISCFSLRVVLITNKILSFFFSKDHGNLNRVKRYPIKPQKKTNKNIMCILITKKKKGDQGVIQKKIKHNSRQYNHLSEDTNYTQKKCYKFIELVWHTSKLTNELSERKKWQENYYMTENVVNHILRCR